MEIRVVELVDEKTTKRSIQNWFVMYRPVRVQVTRHLLTVIVYIWELLTQRALFGRREAGVEDV